MNSMIESEVGSVAGGLTIYCYCTGLGISTMLEDMKDCFEKLDESGMPYTKPRFKMQNTMGEFTDMKECESKCGGLCRSIYKGRDLLSHKCHR